MFTVGFNYKGVLLENLAKRRIPFPDVKFYSQENEFLSWWCDCNFQGNYFESSKQGKKTVAEQNLYFKISSFFTAVTEKSKIDIANNSFENTNPNNNNRYPNNSFENTNPLNNNNNNSYPLNNNNNNRYPLNNNNNNSYPLNNRYPNNSFENTNPNNNNNNNIYPNNSFQNTNNNNSSYPLNKPDVTFPFSTNIAFFQESAMLVEKGKVTSALFIDIENIPKFLFDDHPIYYREDFDIYLFTSHLSPFSDKKYNQKIKIFKTPSSHQDAADVQMIMYIGNIILSNSPIKNFYIASRDRIFSAVKDIILDANLNCKLISSLDQIKNG